MDARQTSAHASAPMPALEGATITTKRRPNRPNRRPLRAGIAFGILAILVGAALAVAQPHEELDPARGVPLSCGLVGTPGTPPRAAMNIVHLANVCGIVGTDVEFQSRTDANGIVRDYAFVGTMGFGFRIYDITNPHLPIIAGGFNDAGWQNDIQVRGDVAVSTFDGVAGEPSTASVCMQTNFPTAQGQGVDIFTLDWDEVTGLFTVANPVCVPNPPGGTHNATLHPSGDWLALSNCCSDWAMDLVDLRDLGNGNAVHTHRYIDSSRITAARCPTTATFSCVPMRRPDGSLANAQWQPHDIFFSADGATMYVAAIQSTFIVDVSDALNGNVSTVSIIPNRVNSDPSDPDNIVTSHQADITADGQILVVTDEFGGGVTASDCNTSSTGKIGAAHFYALAPVDGQPHTANASPSNPVKLGFWVNPDPQPVDPPANFPRLERGCTIHVFRIGGNGSVSPGEIAPGFGGVSTVGEREFVVGFYGAGVWFVDFSGPSDADPNDEITEDPRSTWGNTLGWNIMPGADTWSAKEYKNYIYAGDMLRGFDVYGFADCEDLVECVVNPVGNLPPDANDDAATVERGGSVVVEVLANDTDLNGDSLSVQSHTQGANGSVTDNFDGTLTYTHDGSATTGDSFEYTVRDGRGGADSATVTITVTDPDVEEVGDKVTGGGYLLASDGSKLNFGFNAKQQADGLHGNLQFQDKRAGVKIHLKEVTALHAVSSQCGSVAPGPNAAEFSGTGTFNGATAEFRVCVVDNGEGSGADADRFFLHCLDGCTYSVGERVADDAIDGGNIQVHLRTDAEAGGGSVDASTASVLILDPVLLSSAPAGSLQQLAVRVYGADQEALDGASVSLLATNAAGQVVGSLNAVTNAAGVATFTVTALAGEVEYLATVGGLSSNAVAISGLVAVP